MSLSSNFAVDAFLLQKVSRVLTKHSDYVSRNLSLEDDKVSIAMEMQYLSCLQSLLLAVNRPHIFLKLGEVSVSVEYFHVECLHADVSASAEDRQESLSSHFIVKASHFAFLSSPPHAIITAQKPFDVLLIILGCLCH